MQKIIVMISELIDFYSLRTMEIERERAQDPGIIISSLIDCVSDLLIQMSEDLGDGALDIAEKGEYLL